MRMSLVVMLLWLASPVAEEPVKLILDTDMSGDCDDAGALALLHALADQGECEILATIINRKDLANASAAATSAINTWYGRPEIPIGTDTTLFQPPDAAARRQARQRFGVPDGHVAIGSFALVSGLNTLRFDYGAMQGFSDEAWGLDNVALSGSVTPAVPEPGTWALMLGGLFAVGQVARRRG